MWMSIVLLPYDQYQHQHVLRHSADTEAAVREAVKSINPDAQILHVQGDVTPELVEHVVNQIKADDPGHNPIHPDDLRRRDPDKVKAEQDAAAGKAAPSAADAIRKAREAHARLKAPSADVPGDPAPHDATAARPLPAAGGNPPAAARTPVAAPAK